MPKGSTRKAAKKKAPAQAGLPSYLETANQALALELTAVKEELKHTQAALDAAIDPPMTESELHENIHRRLALAVEQAHFAAAALVVIRGNIPHHSFMVGKDPTAFFKLYTGVSVLNKTMLETLEKKEGIASGKEGA